MILRTAAGDNESTSPDSRMTLKAVYGLVGIVTRGHQGQSYCGSIYFATAFELFMILG